MRFKDFIKLTPEQKTALKNELSDKQLAPNLEPGSESVSGLELEHQLNS
jgi:hypothetical protein